MRNENNQDYTKIVKIAESFGAYTLDNGKSGIVWIRNRKIDLTASGDSEWAVAKNIINQLN